MSTITTHRPVRRRVAAALVTALAAGLLAACGAAPSAGSSASSSSSIDPALADLQKAGVLKIATEGTYAPFSYHDKTTNQLTGYDIEIITAVAGKLGVKPQFSETAWDSIFAGLQAKRYDLVANQVSVTDERKGLYDLSAPYTKSTGVVVVASSNTSITSVADVKGKTAVQSATSNWAGIAKNAGASVQPVEGFTQSVTLIKDGRADLTFNDNLAALDYLKSTGDSGVKVAFQTQDVVYQAFALRKNSGLLPAINKALADLAADGTLTKISQKYFGADVSK